MTVLGAIDIGSNAMRLLIGTLSRSSELTSLDNFREPVRLGHDVFSSGFISEETSRRAVSALKRFKEIIKDKKVSLFRAVATSAVREARNREAFVHRVIEEAEIHLDVIEGEEEARLVHLAVSHAVDLSKGFGLLIDIGGGSIEISLTSDGDVVFSDSIKMGTVRLLQLLGEKKRSPKSFARLVEKYAESIRKRLDVELGKQRVDLCVGTGGNLEALADLCSEKAKESKVSCIEITKLHKLIKELQDLSPGERMDKFGLRADRADVILPAAVVLREIVKQAGISEIRVPSVGLKDGVIIELIPSSGKNRLSYHSRQVLAFARSLGRKYHFDEKHAESVRHFALQLFDELKSIHKLEDEDRLSLEVASLLHDIGQIVSFNGHHKHSEYLIRSNPFVGLSSRERELVALIARYHRKALPREEHANYSKLSEGDRDKVNKLAALLRIAEALDREHEQNVKKIGVKWDKEQVELRLEGEGDLLMERWAVSDKSDLFSRAFDKKFVVQEQ